MKEWALIKQRLYDKRTDTTNSFLNKHILSRNLETNIFDKSEDLDAQNLEGQGLKILTPDQMLNELPITLAKLFKTIQKNLKLRSENYYIHCIAQKKLTKIIY